MITTSRYASEATRKAARELAEREGEAYSARGKKTIGHLAAEARRIGEARIRVIEERAGLPALIATAEVDERGGWRWAGEKPFNPSETDNSRERKG